MGYDRESSNPFGFDRIMELLKEYPKAVQDARGVFEKLKSELDIENSVKNFTSYDTGRKLITVSVDGGNQEIFPLIKEISSSIIRVSSYSEDLTVPLPVFETVIYNRIFLQKMKDFIGKESDESIITQTIEETLDNILEYDICKNFTDKTGITKTDLGVTYKTDMKNFVRIVRDLLEWAYIVELSERYKNIKVLIVKDGSLEQHNVGEEFIKKLKKYFEDNNVLISGVLKHNAIFANGFGVAIITSWITQAKEEPCYFKVPQKLMDYVYSSKRYWDSDFKNTSTFGRRYIGKLLGKTFQPMQSVISVDIPYYVDENEKNLHEIMSTLFAHKQMLFNGSISVVSSAHAKASISSNLIMQIENELAGLIDMKFLL